MRDGEHLRKKRSGKIERFVIGRSKRRMRTGRSESIGDEDDRAWSLE